MKDLKLPIFYLSLPPTEWKTSHLCRRILPNPISQGKVDHFKSGIEVLHEKFTFSTTKSTSNGQISHQVNEFNPTRGVPHSGYNFEYVHLEALESDNKISILWNQIQGRQVPSKLLPKGTEKEIGRKYFYYHNWMEEIKRRLLLQDRIICRFVVKNCLLLLWVHSSTKHC